MTMPKQFDDSMALNETVGQLLTMQDYIKGQVLTPRGIVLVHCNTAGPIAARNSRFRFVWQGRLYIRNISRAYTAKGLARKARQFADEVVEQARQERKL